MFKQLRLRFRALCNERFLRRLALLSGGTVLGSLIAVLSTPVLTRLYTPQDFGVLAVFSSLTAILGTVTCLRYEQAIPVAAGEEEAAALVLWSSIISLGFAAILVVLVWVGGPAFVGLVDAPGLAPWLWLIPPAMLLWGSTLPLSYWSIRLGTFRANAFNKVVQFAAQAVGQIGLGLAGAGSGGLVVGYSVGYLARFGHLFTVVPAGARAGLWRLPRSVLLAAARRHSSYAVYSAPASLLQASTQMLPAIFMAILYGPAAAGLFGLAQRMLEMPVRLLSTTASAVYLGEMRDLDAPGLRRLLVKTAARFLIVGVIGMLPLLVAGPQLFGIVFGPIWAPAGAMVQCLVPVQLARFVVLPISQTLNVMHRQELHLVASMLNVAALALSFLAGWKLDLGPVSTVVIYSIGSAAAYIAYGVLSWQVARGGRAGEIATAGSSDRLP